MRTGRVPKRAAGGRWREKYDSFTLEQLIDLRRKMVDEYEIAPTNTTSIYLMNKKNRKRIDDVCFAITQKMRERRSGDSH